MESKFEVTESNKVFFTFGSLLIIGVSFKQGDMHIGTLVENLILLAGLFFMPLIAGWIGWIASEGKAAVVNVTINSFVVLVVLGFLAFEFSPDLSEKFKAEVTEAVALMEMKRDVQKFKGSLKEAETDEEVQEVFNNYSDKVEKSIQKMADVSSGKEKQFFKVMQTFVADSKKVVKNWHLALNAAAAPEILDGGKLNHEKEFNKQRIILLLYVDQSKKYKKFFHNMVPELTRRLAVIGHNLTLCKEAIREVKLKYNQQKSTFSLLIDGHINQGFCLVKLLDLLKAEQTVWAYKNDQITFYDNAVLNRFNRLIKELQGYQKTINTYSGKMIDLM